MYSINGETYYPQYYDKYEELGVASWYIEECDKCLTHGECDPCITANGELFNGRHLTAAHRTLPMPSMIEVLNLDNGKSIRLRINDRGPFKDNRILDVTEMAAQKLGFKDQGLAMVKIKYLKRATEQLIHSRPYYKESYKRAMNGIKAKKSLFSQNEKKINESSDFYSPKKKRIDQSIKRHSPQLKNNNTRTHYNVKTRYKGSHR